MSVIMVIGPGYTGTTTTEVLSRARRIEGTIPSVVLVSIETQPTHTPTLPIENIKYDPEIEYTEPIEYPRWESDVSWYSRLEFSSKLNKQRAFMAALTRR